MRILPPGWKAQVYEDAKSGLVHLALTRPDSKTHVRWMTPEEANAFALQLLNLIWEKNSEPVYWEDG